MTYLNTTGKMDLFPAAGTGIAFTDHPQIRIFRDKEIPSWIHMAKMIILSVRPHDAIGHTQKRIIGDDPGFDTDGAGKAAGGAGCRKDQFIRGQFERVATENSFLP